MHCIQFTTRQPGVKISDITRGDESKHYATLSRRPSATALATRASRSEHANRECHITPRVFVFLRPVLAFVDRSKLLALDWVAGVGAEPVELVANDPDRPHGQKICHRPDAPRGAAWGVVGRFQALDVVQVLALAE